MGSNSNLLAFTLRIDTAGFLNDLNRAMESVMRFVQGVQRRPLTFVIDLEGFRAQAREATKIVEEELAKAKPAKPTVTPEVPRDIPMAPVNPQNRQEVEQYLVSLRATEAEMRRLGETSQAEYSVVTDSIRLAEKELEKYTAEEEQARKQAPNTGAKPKPPDTSGIFSGIKANLGSLGGQIAGVLKLDQLSNLIPGMNSGMSTFFSTVSSGGPALAALAAGAAAVAAGFQAMLAIGEEFHQAFSTIRTTTGQTGEALHALEGDLKAVFKATGDSNLQDISKNLATLNSTLGVTGEPLRQLTAQFADLDKMGQKVEVRNFARFIGDANVPIQDASKALDQLFVSSQSTGVPIDRLQQLLVKFGAPMRNFGFSVQESMALLGRFEKEGVNTELVMGSLRIAAGKFASAGIDLKTGLAEAITKIKEAKSSSEATAIAMGTFGRRAGADMADTVRNGKFEIQQWLDTIKNSPETIAKARKDVGSFGEEFEKIKRTAMVTLEPLGTLLVEGLTKAAKVVSGIVMPILSGAAPVIAGIAEKAEAFFGFISDHIGIFVMIINPWIGLAMWLEKNFGIMSDLWDAAKELLGLGWDLIVAPFEMLFDMAGAIIDLFSGMGGDGLTLRKIMEQVKITIFSITASIAGLRAAISSVKDSVKEGFGAILHGDVKGAFSALKGLFSKSAEDGAAAFNETMNTKLGELNIDKGRRALADQLDMNQALDLGNSLAKLKTQLAEAKTDAERNNIAATIAEKFPQAVSDVHTFVDASGNISKTYDINTEAIDKHIEKLHAMNAENRPERQKEIVLGLTAQAAAIDEQAKKLDELNRQQAGRKAAGLDTKELDKEIEETSTKMKEASGKFSEDLKSAKTSGLLDNLPADAQKAFDGIRAKYGDTVLRPIEEEAAKSKVGDALAQAATIKTDLDAQGHLHKLIDQLEKAKTDEERNGLAKQIADKVPSAVMGYDKVSGAIQVSAAKAREFAEANEKSLGPQQQQVVGQYATSLRDMTQHIVEAKQHQAELGDKIAETAKRGGDTSALRAEYDALGKKIAASTTELSGFIEKGKQSATIQGDVHDVGKEFQFSAEQAAVAAAAVAEIDSKTKDTTVDIKGLADSFSQVSKEANESLNEVKGAYSKMYLDLKEAIKNRDTARANELRKQMADLRKSGQDQVKDVKDVNAAKKEADKVFDTEEHKKKTVDAQNLADALLSIEKDTADRKKALQNARLADELTRERQTARDKIDADVQAAQDNLRKQNEAIAKAEKDKKPVEIRVLAPDGKSTERLIQGAGNVRAALEAATDKQIIQIREGGLDALLEVDRKFFEKQYQEDSKNASERAKQEQERLKREEETIKGENVVAIAARTQKRLEALQIGQAEEIDTLVRGDEQYMLATTRAQAARSEIDQAKTDEERTQIRKRAELYEKEAADRERALILGDAHILDAEKRYNDERVKVIADGEKAVAEARTKAQEISQTGSDRELAERLAAIDKAYKEQLQAIADGEAAARDLRDAGIISETEMNARLAALDKAREEARVKAAAESFDAQEQYRQKTERSYRDSLTGLKGFIDAIFKTIDEARKSDLQKELADIQKRRDAVLADLKSRTLAFKDYLAQTSALAKQAADKEKQLVGDEGKFWATFYKGAIASLAAIGKSYSDNMSGAFKSLAAHIDDDYKNSAIFGPKGTATFGKLFAGTKEKMEDLENVAASTFGGIGVAFAKLADTGKAQFQDFANAAILQVLKSVQATIAALIPQIMAAFSALGPWGIPAGIAAIATVEGLLAYAEGKVQSSLSKRGFNTGGYTGSEGGIVHAEEFVMKPSLTRMHLPFFERVHIGEHPLLAALAEYGPALSRKVMASFPLPTLALPSGVTGAEVHALARLRAPIPAHRSAHDDPSAMMITGAIHGARRAIEENGDNVSENITRRLRADTVAMGEKIDRLIAVTQSLSKSGRTAI